MKSSVFACLVTLAAATAFAGPVAELSTHNIDLGVIEQGKIVDVPLSVRNTGDAPLTIQKIQFSCHCVSARELTPEERVVPPGAEQVLPIVYDPMNYTGQRHAIIAVTTDDPENPFLEARVDTTIVTPVVMTPPALRWGPTVKGSTLEAQIRLKPGVPGSELTLLNIHVPHPDLEFTKTITEDAGEIVVQAAFRIADSARIGELNSIVEAQVELGDRQFPVRSPLSLFVMGDVMVRPPQVVSINRPIPRGERISTISLLWTRPESPIDLIDLRTGGAIRTETRPMPDRIEVDVFVAADAPAGANAARVELFSTSADEPVSTVPIYFLVQESAALVPSAAVLAPGERVQVTLRSERQPTAARSELAGISATLADAAVDIRADETAQAPSTGDVIVEFEDAPAVRIPVVVRTP